MRLRRGKLAAMAGVPRGNSETMVPGDCQCQLLVARRVDAVGAGADNGNRRTFGGECATMGGSVDPEGEAADNCEPSASQGLGEGLSGLQALGSRVAAADDGDAGALEQGWITANIEDTGWVGNFQQGLRIA